MIFKEFNGTKLPAIGQGTGGHEKNADQINILRQGISLGMTLIDTAEIYQHGHSEKIVGEAIRGHRSKVFVCTKFNPQNSHYIDIIKSAEGSLKRLQTDYIDLYQIHWPNPSVPIEETIQALTDLRKSGKIRFIGVSNFSLYNFMQAQQLTSEKIIANQLEYNLVERTIEDKFLPYAEENGVIILAYTPLLSPRKNFNLIEDLAKKYAKSPTQVILNWLISHKSVIPIPRTSNLRHLQQNAQAADFNLDPQDLALIDEAFKNIIEFIPPHKITVKPSEHEVVYTTLEEAIKNSQNLAPSPQDLAEEIQNNGILKPVQLRKIEDKGKVEYELLQGRMRYWAWIIGFGDKEPIPSIVIN